MPPPSLGPRPKTNPSADRFQYRVFSPLLPNPPRKFAQVRGCEIDSETISQRQGDNEYLPFLPVAP